MNNSWIINLLSNLSQYLHSSLLSFIYADGRKLFGGYKITPKFCTDAKISKSDAKVSGPAICMFNHECVERKGKVIGACMDG